MCFVLCIQKHHLRTFHQAAKGGHGTTKGKGGLCLGDYYGLGLDVMNMAEDPYPMLIIQSHGHI